MKSLATKTKSTTSGVKKTDTQRTSPVRSPDSAARSLVRDILRPHGLQAKLTMGRRDDRYEQEADTVADRVIAGLPVPEISHLAPGSLHTQPIEEEEDLLQPRLQRQPVEEEEEEELQAKEIAGKELPVTRNIETRIGSLKGSGRAIPESLRSYYASRFGRDFSGVRVHDDVQAKNLAEAINARAFTVGRDIFFGQGQYDPATAGGSRLISHELTHTIQQGALQKLQKQETVIQRDISDGLNEAMEGWGTDEEAIFQLTRNASPSEKQSVLNDPALLARLDSELSRGDMLQVLENLNAPLALQLQTALSGWFTDLETISNLFVNAVPQQRLDVLNDAALVQYLVSELGLENVIGILLLVGVDPIVIIHELEAAGFQVDLRGRIERVRWTGGHPLTPYGSELRVNPEWRPGVTDHAAAYTQSASQVLDVNIVFDQILVPVSNVWVKGTIGTSELLGTGSVSSGGIVLSLGSSGLPNSTQFGRQDYAIDWQTSTDNTTWRPAGISSPHHIYWLVGSPNWTLYSLAAEKATGYAPLNTDPATAVRMGIHGEITYLPSDPNIEANPLSMYAGGGHVCADFANIQTALSETIGLTANPRIIFGGILAAGQMMWVSPTGADVTLFHVMPGSHIFNYHAVSDVGGTLQDAALNRTGVSADAVMAGVSLRFIDLSAASPPSGVAGTFYSHFLDRTPTPVAVQHKPFANLLDSSSFFVSSLSLPMGTTGVRNVGVTWSITTGSLPPGLHLSGSNGRISGTPTTPGTYTFTLQVDGGSGFIASRPLSITVT